MEDNYTTMQFLEWAFYATCVLVLAAVAVVVIIEEIVKPRQQKAKQQCTSTSRTR